MLTASRHRFVSADWRRRACEDTPLPIGHGVTISQPIVVGMLTQLLAAGRRHSVLEIGTGSGYQAAVLAQLARVHDRDRAGAGAVGGRAAGRTGLRQCDGTAG